MLFVVDSCVVVVVVVVDVVVLFVVVIIVTDVVDSVCVSYIFCHRCCSC